MKLRPEQSEALGGCAPCQTAGFAGGPRKDEAGSGPAPKSVIIVDPTKADVWIGIELVDSEKKPVPLAPFVATPPGHPPISGTLDANGKARIEGIDPGPVTIEFPTIDRRDFV